MKQRILGVVGDRLFAEAEVVAVSHPAPRFRMISLQSPALVGREWIPGAKVQINVGAWNVRTYTPLSLERESGTLKILVYLHGDGADAPGTPGTEWAARVRPGNRCRFMGPRPSLRGAETETSLIIYGDETAIPMAATYQQHGNTETRAVFEVEDIAHAAAAAQALNLTAAQFFPMFPRQTADAPVALQTLAALSQEHGHAAIILAGHAQSIQHARTYLRDRGIPMSRLKIKVYWADGRTGLD